MLYHYYLALFQSNGLLELTACHFIATFFRFRATGWNVVTVKYGKELLKLFAEPVGGKRIKRWVREVDNGLYGSLVFRGGRAFRDQIAKDTGNDADVMALLTKFSDDELAVVMSNLGGHCMEVRAAVTKSNIFVLLVLLHDSIMRVFADNVGGVSECFSQRPSHSLHLLYHQRLGTANSGPSRQSW